MGIVQDTLLFDIERYCNNFFNPRNDPTANQRDYPASFLELAGRITEYIENAPNTNVVNESVGSYSVSRNIEYAPWQKAFARELSIYKRAKFL